MELSIELLKNLVSVLSTCDKEIPIRSLQIADTVVVAHENERSVLQKRVQTSKLFLADELRECEDTIYITSTFVLELAQSLLEIMEENEIDGQEIWDLEDKIKSLEKSETYYEDKVEDLKDRITDLEKSLFNSEEEITVHENALEELRHATKTYLD